MTTSEAVRESWLRRGVVGHCPVCHRKEWEEAGDVSLPSADEGEALRVGTMSCHHCNALLFLVPEA